MASIHLREFSIQGKAILFENIKGTKYSAISNLFGTLESSRFIFRNRLSIIRDLISLKTNPSRIFRNPINSIRVLLNAIYAIPKKIKFPRYFEDFFNLDSPFKTIKV